MNTRNSAFKIAAWLAALAVASVGCTISRAETTDFSGVIASIKTFRYDEAEAAIDAILKKEPNNVNALMYKGNLRFYRGSNSGRIQFFGNEDESIYDDSIGYLGEDSSIVSREAARDAANYYMRALAVAPTRMDIQLGLCWAYANGGMKDELIGRFAALRQYSGNKTGLQYNMGDYARIIAENYSLADGMAVYREIARLYPDDGNIANDMAAMYFKKGDLDTALRYFTEAAGKKNRDDTTLENLALIYAVTGAYDKSAQAQKTASRLKNNATYPLYEALYKRLVGTPGWEEQVKAFISQNKARKQYAAYVEFAATLLPTASNPFDQYRAGGDKEIPSHFQILNDEWAARQFPGRFEPIYLLANLLTYYQNYRRALPLYERIEQSKLARSTEELEKLHFSYAWALYRAGQIEAANERWKALLDSHDFYRKSAAAYFLGNYYYKKKDYKQAIAYFKRVEPDAAKSKYATYCDTLHRSIEQEKQEK